MQFVLQSRVLVPADVDVIAPEMDVFDATDVSTTEVEPPEMDEQRPDDDDDEADVALALLLASDASSDDKAELVPADALKLSTVLLVSYLDEQHTLSVNVKKNLCYYLQIFKYLKNNFN